MVKAMKENARDLERELDWFAEVLDARLKTLLPQTERGRVGL